MRSDHGDKLQEECEPALGERKAEKWGNYNTQMVKGFLSSLARVEVDTVGDVGSAGNAVVRELSAIVGFVVIDEVRT